MNLHLKGAAKRLLFSLSVAASLAGCAVYDPYPATYSTYDPYGYGYPYGQPGYSGVPYYVGPPITLGLSFESHRGHGFRGHHVPRRHHGFGHRGWGRGAHHGGWGHGSRGGRR